MVYISNDGKVYDKQPWSFSRILAIFLGIFAAIKFFIESLIAPFTNPDGYRPSDTRGRGGGGGGGGGGSGGNGGSGPPRPPRRPIGRINHSANVTVPGGCSSCQ